MVEWIGLALAVGATYIAWRANNKSDAANDISRRALAVSEAEHEDRRHERQARAQIVVSAHVLMFNPNDDGVIRLGGSHGTLRTEISIVNAGDRDAGRGNVEVTLPLTISDMGARWTDPSGRELPEFPQRAARVGDANLLLRPIDGVARNVPERMWFTVPVTVPNGGDVNEYPIRIAVAAEGAEDRAVYDFPLRIGRDPSQ
jgi:hypothetical protein